MLNSFIVVIISQSIHQVITLYTLNLHNVIWNYTLINLLGQIQKKSLVSSWENRWVEMAEVLWEHHLRKAYEEKLGRHGDSLQRG